MTSRAIISLGSNLGSRAKNISAALNLLSRRVDMKVLRTSFLYETPPAYKLDQPSFLNAVAEIECNLTPKELLQQLQIAERQLGRTSEMRAVPNGPRPIDLDILMFNNEKVQTDELTIPHPRIGERPFVLGPLLDLHYEWATEQFRDACAKLIPSSHPQAFGLPTSYTWDAVSLSKVLPIRKRESADTLWHWHDRVRIMGIVNCTPDSFSDGGCHVQVDSALQHVVQMVNAGADIIDIGGESTRPDASVVDPDTEALRVLPVIEAIRAHDDPKVAGIPISVDTYKACVAERAIKAGADIINDISGGTYDAGMLQTVSELSVPYILMHTRGTPKTMLDKENITYNDVTADVCTTLQARVLAAEEAQIARWNLILDPGFGFAKTPAQSLQLLRQFRDSIPRGFPSLSAPSRKGFIGHFMGDRATGDARSLARMWGTSAAVAASVANGANIIRVHDVPEMVAAAAMAEAIWRTSPRADEELT